jgi:hypothetical protein
MPRCQNCGLFGMCTPSGELKEAPIQMRRGSIDVSFQNMVLICAKRVRDFQKDAHENAQKGKEKSKARIDVWRELLWEEHTCKEWNEWVPGFSPKDHLQIMMTNELQKELARQAEVSRINQMTHEKQLSQMQVEATVAIGKAQIAVADATKRVTLYVGIAATIVSLISAAAAIAPLFKQDKPVEVAPTEVKSMPSNEKSATQP